MSFKYYKISRFRSQEDTYKSKWLNISDFIKNNQVVEFNKFLETEKSFIKFLKMFYTYFSQGKEEFGFSRVAYQIILSEELVDDKNALIYYGFNDEDVKDKLQYLSRFNLNYFNDDDIDFIFKCWVRGLCELYLFDIATNSSLKPMEDSFYFSLVLNEDIEVAEIFSFVEGVYVYVDFDQYTSNEDYQIPSNYGERINLN